MAGAIAASAQHQDAAALVRFIVSRRQRTALAGHLRSFLAMFPHVAMVVTSREAGYRLFREDLRQMLVNAQAGHARG